MNLIRCLSMAPIIISRSMGNLQAGLLTIGTSCHLVNIARNKALEYAPKLTKNIFISHRLVFQRASTRMTKALVRASATHVRPAENNNDMHFHVSYQFTAGAQCIRPSLQGVLNGVKFFSGFCQGKIQDTSPASTAFRDRSGAEHQNSAEPTMAKATLNNYSTSPTGPDRCRTQIDRVVALKKIILINERVVKPRFLKQKRYLSDIISRQDGSA
jgi:hypothetical protein